MNKDKNRYYECLTIIFLY